MSSIIEFLDEEEHPQEEITPTLAEVIKQATEAFLLDVRVALPAEVIRYDKDKQLVDVQPFFKRKYRDDSLVDSPVIYNVPVAFPRAGEAYISLPIKKGHSVLLVFADRSLEKWLTSGQKTDPEDIRSHHIADAIAYPGLYPFSDPIKINNDDDIIIKNGGDNDRLEIRIKKNNHLQIINKESELIKILCDWMRAMREAQTYTSIGQQPLRHHKFEEIEQKLRSFFER